MILDNMTLVGAARALGADIERDAPSVDRRGDKKWDYDANDKLQATIDIVCLAQLCQALVLHEHVATTSDFADRWRMAGGPMDAVHELIDVIPVQEDKTAVLESSSAAAATTIAATEEFRRYVSLLAEEPVIGTFLRISNGYFETGYSDPGLFGDVVAHHGYFLRAAGLVREARRLMDEGRRLPEEDPSRAATLRRAAWSDGVAEGFLSAEERLRVYGYGADRDAHPLGELDFSEKDRLEAAGGAVALVKNLAAMMYYGTIARVSQAEYMPHPLRAPLGVIAYEDESLRLSEDGLVRRLNFLRDVRAAKLNELVTMPGDAVSAVYVDRVFPFVLALALEESSTADDLIRQVLLLRESPPAARIRRWFVRFREDLQHGDVALDTIESTLRTLDDEVSRWMGMGHERGRPSHAITVGISLAFLSLGKEVRVAQPARLRDFRLIQDLARISNASPSLAPALRRVFGPSTADAWTSSQQLLHSLRAPGSGSVLDRR